MQNQLYIYIHTYVYTCVSKELRVCLYLFDISSIVYAFEREREKKIEETKLLAGELIFTDFARHHDQLSCMHAIYIVIFIV